MTTTPTDLRALADALEESAREVESFPHPSHCDHLHAAEKVMRAAAVALRAAEGDARDARRYQWLRDSALGDVWEDLGYMRHDHPDRDAPKLDVAIDAAIAQEQKP